MQKSEGKNASNFPVRSYFNAFYEIMVVKEKAKGVIEISPTKASLMTEFSSNEFVCMCRSLSAIIMLRTVRIFMQNTMQTWKKYGFAESASIHIPSVGAIFNSI